MASSSRAWIFWIAAAIVALALTLAIQDRGGERITDATRTTFATVGYRPPPPLNPSVPDGPAGQAAVAAPPPLWAPSAAVEPPAHRDPGDLVRAEGPAAKPDDGRQLYLYIPRWKSDGTLAIYALTAGRSTNHTPTLQWNGTNQPLWIALPRTTASRPPTRLDLRLQHVRGIGGAFSSVWIGDYGQLAPGYYVRDFFQVRLPAFSALAFLVTGVFALFVSVQPPGPSGIYLLYFLTSAACFLRMLHTFVGVEPLFISDAWFGWITVDSTFWMILTLHLFAAELHGARQPRLDQYDPGSSGADGASPPCRAFWIRR
ncbi:hypothetical protein ACRAWD_19950 [Caulobacter segnis]